MPETRSIRCRRAAAVSSVQGRGLRLAVLLVAGFAMAATGAEAEMLFASFLSFDAGERTAAVACGDFDGDGKLDVAVSNHGYGGTPGNTVSVLLGEGGGTFGAKTDYPTGSYPSGVTIGDLNEDGRPDLAVACAGSAVVSVLLGNGDGTFGATTDYETGGSPVAIAIGDLNEDGRADLAVACAGSAAVSVLLGNGDGTFGTGTAYPTAGGPGSVAIGDLNGDGNLDLATASPGSDTASVLLGNGDGTFGTHHDYATWGGPAEVAIRDVNQDEMPDLITANKGWYWPPHTSAVSVLLNLGDGTLGPQHEYHTDDGACSVVIGDLNGDGIWDLATANYDACTVSVLLGRGNGTFETHQDYRTGVNPTWVAIGDLNADGHLDLATANDCTVAVLLGDGEGGVGTRNEYGAAKRPYSVAIGDVNRDGSPDLAVASLGEGAPGDTVSVMLGNGDGTFGARTDFQAGTAPHAVAVGDLNADGNPDLVVANSGSNVSVLLGNGDGTFGTKTDYDAPNEPSSVAIADFNRDGTPDLAVANGGDYYHPGQTVSVRLGNGDGTFAPRTEYGSGWGPYAVACGDLNRDDRLDLVTANDDGSVSVLLGNAAGTFEPRTDYGTGSGSGPRSVAIGDLNGDATPDLAVASTGRQRVSVFLGNGDGTFWTRTDYGIGGSPFSVAIGDLNGDGRPDLAAGKSSAVSVLIGVGDGTFGMRDDYGTGFYPNAVAIGDLNGDGKLDLATANVYASTVSVLMNIGHGPSSVPLAAVVTEPLLARISPNPAHGPVRVQFAVPRAGRVTLGIHDVTGRLVRAILYQSLTPGQQTLSWDARDSRGSLVPTGVYCIELRVDGARSVERLAILR